MARLDLDDIILDKLERHGPATLQTLAVRCHAPGPINYHDTVVLRIYALLASGHIEKVGDVLQKAAKPMTAPEPRDEAPRWHEGWHTEDEWLIRPDGTGVALLAEKLSDADTAQLVDTLNAGERVHEIQMDLRKWKNWHAALQERVRVLEGVVRFYADPRPHLLEDDMMPDFYNELDFGERAERALAGTEEGVKRVDSHIEAELAAKLAQERINKLWGPR